MQNYSNENNIANRNWFLKTTENNGSYWFLSPDSYYYSHSIVAYYTGSIISQIVCYSGFYIGYHAVRPTLYLKSDTVFVGNGDGSKLNPYRLISE